MKMVVVLCLLIVVSTSPLCPILDGRTAPIVVDTRYTFTNFEWARGFVKFCNGFDLPSGGTAILDITEQVRGIVNLNGGTLFLDGDLEFNSGTFGSSGNLTGTGYIRARTVQRELVLSKNLVLSSTIRLFIQGELLIRGKGGAALYLSVGNGGLLSMKGATRMSFADLIINDVHNNAFVTTNINPFLLTFYNCNLIMNSSNPATINSQQVQFFGANNIITGFNSTMTMSYCTIQNGSSLYINPTTTFQIQDLETVVNGSIVLDNATLDFKRTYNINAPIPIGGTVTAAQGDLFVVGKSKIKSSGGHKLYASPSMGISMFPGSRLAIAPGTFLTIQ